jgi:hypothetical protein
VVVFGRCFHHSTSESRNDIVGAYTNRATERIKRKGGENRNFSSVEGRAERDKVRRERMRFWGCYTALPLSTVIRPWSKSDDRPKNRTCPGAMFFEAMHDSHSVLDNGSSFSLIASDMNIIFYHDYTHKPKLLQIY